MSKRFWLGTIVLVWALACVGAPPEVRVADGPGPAVTPGTPRVEPVAKGVGKVPSARASGHGDASVEVPGSEPLEGPVHTEGIADVPASAPSERTEVLLDRGVLERDLAAVESVSEVIGLRPNLTLRGIDGFEVTDLPPGSPLAGIGLQRGDVVHSVNGHALTSLQSALQAGEALQDATVLEGVVTRDGRERTLVVRLE